MTIRSLTGQIDYNSDQADAYGQPLDAQPLEMGIDKGLRPDFTLQDLAILGGLKGATNLIRANSYYWPSRNLTDYNITAVEGTPINGFMTMSSDNTHYNFVGTSSRIYCFTQGQMIDATRDHDPYAGSTWSWVTYGDWLIATNYTDEVQVLKGISLALGGQKFVNLGGTPPKGKYSLFSNGHYILANIDEDGNAYPKKIRWSARENPENWTASVTTGADSQEFPGMDGIITGITPIGDNFAIFATDSITTASYIGGQYTFSFKHNYVPNIGCAYPGSLISIGQKAFFWSKKSIWKFDGTSAPEEIGLGIKNALFSSLSSGATDTISSCHDQANNLIYWPFPTGTATHPDKVLVYNYQEDVFTIIDYDIYFLMMGVTGGLTSDTMSDPSDSLSIPSDSPFYRQGTQEPIACTALQKMAIMRGSNMSAAIQTGEIGESDRLYQVINVLVPAEGTGSSGTIIIEHRYSSFQQPAQSSLYTIRPDGWVDCRLTNRRFSITMNLTNIDKLGNKILLYVNQAGRR